VRSAYLDRQKERGGAEGKEPDGIPRCEGHEVYTFIKECSIKCSCTMNCGNRVVQRGITARLQVIPTMSLFAKHPKKERVSSHERFSKEGLERTMFARLCGVPLLDAIQRLSPHSG
jgi:hypothetical protein